MATAGATRTYPTTVIPSDPTDANFEADFRTSTELLQTAVKDVDDEVSVARGASATLSARLTAISAVSGVQASFWTVDSNASGSAGNSFITVTGNATSTYVIGRPIRIITSSGTYYGYVKTSSYTSSTTVNLATNAAGTALTITGTVTNIAHATMDSNLNWLVSFDKLSSTATATLNGTAVAMAIALG